MEKIVYLNRSFKTFDEVEDLKEELRRKFSICLRICHNRTVDGHNRLCRMSNDKADLVIPDRWRYYMIKYVCSPQSVNGHPVKQCSFFIHIKYCFKISRLEIKEFSLTHSHPDVDYYLANNNQVKRSTRNGSKSSDKVVSSFLNADKGWLQAKEELIKISCNSLNVVVIFPSIEHHFEAIYIQLEEQREVFRILGDVLIFDSSPLLAENSINLYSILVCDEFGTSIPVGYILIRNTYLHLIQRCIQIFISKNNRSIVKTIIVGTEDQFPVFKTLFPSADVLLCQLYVSKMVQSQLSNQRKFRREYLELFNTALQTNSEEEFKEAKSSLVSITGAIGQYFTDKFFGPNAPLWSLLDYRTRLTKGNFTAIRVQHFSQYLETFRSKLDMHGLITSIINAFNCINSDRDFKLLNSLVDESYHSESEEDFD